MGARSLELEGSKAWALGWPCGCSQCWGVTVAFPLYPWCGHLWLVQLRDEGLEPEQEGMSWASSPEPSTRRRSAPFPVPRLQPRGGRGEPTYQLEQAERFSLQLLLHAGERGRQWDREHPKQGHL